MKDGEENTVERFALHDVRRIIDDESYGHIILSYKQNDVVVVVVEHSSKRLFQCCCLFSGSFRHNIC